MVKENTLISLYSVISASFTIGFGGFLVSEENPIEHFKLNSSLPAVKFFVV
jgi:hypothetical protein